MIVNRYILRRYYVLQFTMLGLLWCITQTKRGWNVVALRLKAYGFRGGDIWSVTDLKFDTIYVI